MPRRVPPDPRYAAIRLDANFFDDSIGPAERAAADELLSLDGPDGPVMAIPHSVRRELDHPNTPAATRRRASELPFTYDTGMGDPSRAALVRDLMRGNAAIGKHDQDAAHLYDAAVWQAGYFVTCDQRILDRAESIRALLEDVFVVRPTELLGLYRDAVRRGSELGH